MFCDMRIVDGAGRELPHDGKAVGHLQVGGPCLFARCTPAVHGFRVPSLAVPALLVHRA